MWPGPARGLGDSGGRLGRHFQGGAEIAIYKILKTLY